MKKLKSNSLLNHWPFILFILVYFCLISFLVITKPAPFFDWDEAIYAQVGREMIRGKSFLVPLWQGAPWLDKPPIPSLFYGIVELFPIIPEISTRIATLFLSCIALFLIYVLSYRITKEKIISLLTVIITAFLPIFFQRSMALNVDVFLLIGWLGYVIWFDNFLVSTFMLLLAVLSKSLLGFFPPLLFIFFFFYELFFKRIKKDVFSAHIKKITLQILLCSLWFMGMTIVYKYPFIQYQFIDSHFKRVTASIEQHFGQRTFYVDILVDQFKFLLIPAFGSLSYLAFVFFKKKADKLTVLLSVFFVPWFIFLNLTKTKIAWYIYPVLPQFAFLSVYPLIFLKKKPVLVFSAALFMLLIFFFAITPMPTLLANSFSKMEDHHLIALDAKKNSCKELFVLVGDSTRTSYATLKSMNLVISTTTWWGSHPSIAYYADTKTTYLYTIQEALQKIAHMNKSDCIIFEKNDESKLSIVDKFEKQATNNTYFLFQAR